MMQEYGVKPWVKVFPRKHTDFGEWYRKVLFDADVLDQRFPLKGCNVWKGYGTKIMDNIMNILEDLLDESDHEKTYFPLLIPEDVFSKESKHLKGFEDQVFWVNKAGANELTKKLVVRPTSETAMYQMFPLWVRSHADLPIRVYQTVSVFRYETRSTKPLIRDREIWPFNEAHTLHATPDEAEEQVKIGVEIYRELFRRLALPYLLVRKPTWELFPGAVMCFEFYTMMPDGKLLETGSVNNLGQSFSKVFDITFEKEDGTHDHAYQTCYGQSERLLASVIAIHSDDHGLVLPSSIAPIQAVIVPISYTGDAEKVTDYVATVEKRLQEGGFRVTLDSSAMTPGEKYYHWERKGVPIRVEVGPRETKKKIVTIVRRHTLQKREVPLEDLTSELKEALEEVDNDLLMWAEDQLRASINHITNLSEIQEGRILCAPFCGEERCRDIIEAASVEIIGLSLKENVAPTRCIACDNQATESVYIARTY